MVLFGEKSCIRLNTFTGAFVDSPENHWPSLLGIYYLCLYFEVKNNIVNWVHLCHL